MAASVFPIHDGLADASRWPALVRDGQGALRPRASVAEIGLLLLLGVGAALAVLLLDFRLRLPGHAILRSVLPMALGMALVPRRMAGSIMGAGAIFTALAYSLAMHGAKGPGSLTSLCLTGPLLDLALWTARSGWRLYLGFILAGLAANLAALALQTTLKAYGFDAGGGGGGRGGGKSLAVWLPLALVTYPTFGLTAGLVSAVCWFQFRSRRRTDAPPKDIP